MNLISENRSLPENFFTGYIRRINITDTDNSKQLIDSYLDETVRFTGSRIGYILELNNVDPGRLNIITCKGDTAGEPDPDKAEQVIELVTRELINGRQDEDMPVIISGSAKEKNYMNECKPDSADMIYLLPLDCGNILVAVMVLFIRQPGIEKDTAAALHSIFGLFWKTYSNSRIAGEMKSLKEKAEGNERLKNKFMINVSHEIKTPVNAIVGFSNLLAEPDIAPEIRKKYLDIILSSSDELLTITRDFAEISNLEYNLQRTRKQDVNIRSVLSELADQFSPRARSKNLKLTISAELKEDEYILYTDLIKLKQVFSCLINNAFKFTYSGSIDLGCRRNENFMEFRVTDTGIGMSGLSMHNIFNFFSLGENVLVKYSEGPGIGLALSYSYVKHLGGDIWFTSSEGVGSVFCFTLPYQSAGQKTRIKGTKSAESVLSSDADRVILVAEDDDNNYFLIENILKKEKYKVIRAKNGQEAVDICASEKIDLVFMDIKMPVMDGYTAAKKILEFMPDQKIIAQTAYQGERDLAIRQGCVDFIAKPFSRQQLITMITSYL
jgi:signal transduction histidine kinase